MAVANDEVFAVKDEGGLAQPGEVGELYVRGRPSCAAIGETRNEPLGAWCQTPLVRPSPPRVYRTGDLVEVQPGGVYRYVDRRDAQIKSRGYRIELGDVETALNLHPGVVECAVVAVADELVTNRLVAYVTVRDQSTEQDLAIFWGERLPRIMVPGRSRC